MMVTIKTISYDGKSKRTYGINGKNGDTEYSFDDISTNKSNAEIIDKMISAVVLPAHLIERIVFSLTGILTEASV